MGYQLVLVVSLVLIQQQKAQPLLHCALLVLEESTQHQLGLHLLFHVLAAEKDHFQHRQARLHQLHVWTVNQEHIHR